MLMTNKKFPPLSEEQKKDSWLAKKNNQRMENPIKCKWRQKFDELEKVFEELLAEQFATSEVRDQWRKKAGLTTFTIED